MASGSDTCGSHPSSRVMSSLISASLVIGSPVREAHTALPSMRQAPRSHIPHPGRSTRHAGRGPGASPVACRLTARHPGHLGGGRRRDRRLREARTD
jgi:hypothetical protein